MSAEIKIDPYSSTWKNVQRYLAARCTALRLSLESELSPEDTIRVRAKLKELNALVAATQFETPLVEEDISLPE